MALKIYYDKDCDIELLKQKTVAIIGFGAQGVAQAANLRDSGIPLIVGLRREKGSSWVNAVKQDFDVRPIAEAVQVADLVMLLIPDEVQAEVYEKKIASNLKEGATIGFAHGFNIHYGYINPGKGINVMMVAPKGQGKAVRSTFEEGGGVAALWAVANDASGNTKDLALAYAAANGCGRTGIIETTFKNETESDLFSEQSVLCGGMMDVVLAGFETLTEAGYPPEIAYFECLHELKLVVDLLYEGGYKYMRETISNTAEYGAMVAGKQIVTPDVRKAMRDILKDIQSGKFADDFMEEATEGYKHLKEDREKLANHPIEEVGGRLRKIIFKNKL
ncbi:ketol-acid reductoisomerase [Balneicella halophila]|uniref:Ketol-acid reductoisomerase (NADP(+)) n=1 Tax=Balneicella halophila TaxID=1537566 RepID=A0A7L4US03_BALHA|nr:ketol-acid reductoisomerase [Balneicella halophila]PVX52565.1 ketol-acid reductoisomerase [Balneicella halophila]